MNFDFTKIVHGFIVDNLDKVLLLVTVVCFINLLVFITINVKLSRLTKKYSAMMKGSDGKNLETILMEYAESVRTVISDISKVKERLSSLEKDALSAVQKVHIKRYNAFEDMGGNLSFSMALLNGHNSGVIITSIHGREESRVYLKPVVNGRSQHLLSPEEKEVLEKAVSGGGFLE
ncbi:MAG: DUF4446 family protein [Thermosediminibacteraceae bacterium]|nr:DUF4446 family protein [Thermosediminibacteraceae bacterium]